jgi:hypothetical protein
MNTTKFSASSFRMYSSEWLSTGNGPPTCMNSTWQTKPRCTLTRRAYLVIYHCWGLWGKHAQILRLPCASHAHIVRTPWGPGVLEYSVSDFFKYISLWELKLVTFFSTTRSSRYPRPGWSFSQRDQSPDFTPLISSGSARGLTCWIRKEDTYSKVLFSTNCFSVHLLVSDSITFVSPVDACTCLPAYWRLLCRLRISLGAMSEIVGENNSKNRLNSIKQIGSEGSCTSPPREKKKKKTRGRWFGNVSSYRGSYSPLTRDEFHVRDRFLQGASIFHLQSALLTQGVPGNLNLPHDLPNTSELYILESSRSNVHPLFFFQRCFVLF